MKIGIGKLLSKKEFFIVALFFLLILFILFFTFFTPNYYKGRGPVKVEVRKGESFSEISNDLYSKGIIPRKTNFEVTSYLWCRTKD